MPNHLLTKILVINNTEKGFIERTADLYSELHVGVDMDLLVYTPEEYERQRKRGLVRHALGTGRVVYEKERP